MRVACILIGTSVNPRTLNVWFSGFPYSTCNSWIIQTHSYVMRTWVHRAHSNSCPQNSLKIPIIHINLSMTSSLPTSSSFTMVWNTWPTVLQLTAKPIFCATSWTQGDTIRKVDSRNIISCNLKEGCANIISLPTNHLQLSYTISIWNTVPGTVKSRSNLRRNHQSHHYHLSWPRSSMKDPPSSTTSS